MALFCVFLYIQLLVKIVPLDLRIYMVALIIAQYIVIVMYHKNAIASVSILNTSACVAQR